MALSGAEISERGTIFSRTLVNGKQTCSILGYRRNMKVEFPFQGSRPILIPFS